MMLSAALLAMLLAPAQEIPAPLVDVVRMSAQGYADETIVSYVRLSDTQVALTPPLWRLLRGLGVREPVLRALNPLPPSVIVVQAGPPHLPPARFRRGPRCRWP